MLCGIGNLTRGELICLSSSIGELGKLGRETGLSWNGGNDGILKTPSFLSIPLFSCTIPPSDNKVHQQLNNTLFSLEVEQQLSLLALLQGYIKASVTIRKPYTLYSDHMKPYTYLVCLHLLCDPPLFLPLP